MIQVTNLTTEAGGEAVLRCTILNTSTRSSTGPVGKLKASGEPEEGASDASKSCSWELDGEEIEMSSSRHSLSYFPESQVSLGHLTLMISHNLGMH